MKLNYIDDINIAYLYSRLKLHIPMPPVKDLMPWKSIKSQVKVKFQT